jgi:hypothetical protein
MKNAVLCDVTPCCFCKNRRCGGMYCLHHQGDKCFFAVCVGCYVPPKHRRRNIPEDGILQPLYLFNKTFSNFHQCNLISLSYCAITVCKLMTQTVQITFYEGTHGPLRRRCDRRYWLYINIQCREPMCKRSAADQYMQ